jgi:hypothetical protein
MRVVNSQQIRQIGTVIHERIVRDSSCFFSGRNQSEPPGSAARGRVKLIIGCSHQTKWRYSGGRQQHQNGWERDSRAAIPLWNLSHCIECEATRRTPEKGSSSLTQAVEYYSVKNDPRCQNYLRALQAIMNNELLQVLLTSQDEQPAPSRKDYQSITLLVWFGSMQGKRINLNCSRQFFWVWSAENSREEEFVF